MLLRLTQNILVYSPLIFQEHNKERKRKKRIYILTTNKKMLPVYSPDANINIGRNER